MYISKQTHNNNIILKIQQPLAIITDYRESIVEHKIITIRSFFNYRIIK